MSFEKITRSPHAIVDLVLLVAGFWGILIVWNLFNKGNTHGAALIAAIMVGAGVVRFLWQQSRQFDQDVPQSTSEIQDIAMLGAKPQNNQLQDQDTDFFERLAERLPDPLVVVEKFDTANNAPDPNLQVIYANAEARRLFKLTPGSIPLGDAIRQAEIQEAVAEVFGGGRSRTISYQAAGAVDRFWRATLSPLSRDRSKPVSRVIIVLHDETAAKRNERMRADFLANASHELRTPLASLSGFIETIKGPAKDDPAACDRFLGIMTVQAERMMRLINDLLSLSRVELNEHIPPSNEVDLAKVLEDVLDGLAPIAAERGITIEKAPSFPPSPVLGDSNELTQVIQNLVHNAVKYSEDDMVVKVELQSDADAEQALTPADPGAPRVSVLTPEVQPGNRYVVFHVYDQGRGVDRQYLPRLCERFYRVEGQKSGDREGTGLGLAIVKHIVNRHQGGFIIESRVDKGSVFSVYFPYHNGQDE